MPEPGNEPDFADGLYRNDFSSMKDSAAYPQRLPEFNEDAHLNYKADLVGSDVRNLGPVEIGDTFMLSSVQFFPTLFHWNGVAITFAYTQPTNLVTGGSPTAPQTDVSVVTNAAGVDELIVTLGSSAAQTRFRVARLD